MKCLLFALIGLSLFSCKKELSYCENHQVGDLRVINNEADAFTVYLDGAILGTIPASSSATYHNKRSNTYSFKAVQAENFDTSPYETTYSIEIVNCETTIATLQ